MFSFLFLSPSLAPPPSVSHSFILVSRFVLYHFIFIPFHSLSLFIVCMCVCVRERWSCLMNASFLHFSSFAHRFVSRRTSSRFPPLTNTSVDLYIVNLIFCFIAFYFSRFSYTKHSCNHFSRRLVRIAALAITHKNIVFQINYFPASVCECLLAAAATTEQQTYPVGKLLLIRNLRQSYLSS